ncbi:hypothetical protein D3C87_1352700 [compost metagenome]
MLTAEYAFGLFEQTLQQTEFVAGQVQGLAAIGDLHALVVDAKQCRRSLGQIFRPHTLENRPNPRRHFTGAERLDHVIVGTNFQPHDTIDFTIAGTEKHYRHFAETPQLLAGFEAADIRQADVEDDQVRRGLPLMFQRRRTQGQPRGREALALQGENQGVGNRRFVFDNQDMRHGVRAWGLSGRTVTEGGIGVNPVRSTGGWVCRT